jgi:hypothetical protein
VLKRLIGMALIAGTFATLNASTAAARMWKATPEAVARDYATINDTRPGGEVVVLMWFVPAMVRPDALGAANATAMLRKYVALTAVHARLDKVSGTLSFENIDALQPSDQTGRPLTAIARDDLPPTLAAMLATMETIFRQGLGSMGQGMKMFIFEAGGVDSCKKGRMSVPLADETYTWDMPFPGCATN